MADPASPAPDAQGSLDAVVREWSDALTRISREEAAQADRLVDETLLEAETVDAYVKARGALLGVVVASRGVTDALQTLVDRVDKLQSEWTAARRWTDAGLTALEGELEDAFEREGVEAARRWLHEIVDAVREREWDAAIRIAGAALAFPAELREGVDVIGSSLSLWRDGGQQEGLDLMETIARGELPGWADVLDPKLRSRAHRLAAWVSMRLVGDAERAKTHLDSAVELDPYRGRSYAERAAYFLAVGDLERGAADAQRAVELAPEDAAGYLYLGTWAELNGQFEDAQELYQRGLERMPNHAIGMLTRRASLLDPPGRLLLAAAEKLLSAGRLAAALTIADAALVAGVHGSRPYPDADVHRVRSLALEGLPGASRADAAAAATEAGKRYLWNGENDAAINELTRALGLDESIEETGWFLADALSGISFPPSQALPDQATVARARTTWESWRAKLGPPNGATSWAYLTRAVIADLESLQPGRDHEAGLWEALVYAERALVHDEGDGQRWGFAAKYLRAVDQDELAYEAAERAFELAPSNSVVLTERLALLANRGRFDDAAAAASDLIATQGEDPFVRGVQAWLAFHQGRLDDALAFLELPLTQPYNLAWHRYYHALCHLRKGDVSSAVGDFEDLRRNAKPVEGIDKCLIGAACVVLRDLPAAERSLEDARDDPTTRAIDYLTYAGYAALAGDDLDRGSELIGGALRAAVNAREVDDVDEILLLLRPLDEGDEASAARERTTREVLENVGRERKAWLESHAPTPESEVSDRLREHDTGASGAELGAVMTALLAVRSRRQLRAGDVLEAAEGYERLRSSMFEPEATIALTRALTRASEERAARGDVEDVRRIQQALTTIGAVDTVGAGLAVASALEASGRLDEARNDLSMLIAEARNDGQREELHQRLGELALAAGDVEAAAEEFGAALRIATRSDDESRVAQLEARMSLVAFLAGDRPAALRRVSSALDAWRAAGAFEPAWTLVEELRGLVAGRRPRGTPAEWRTLVADALRATFERLQGEGQLAEYADAELDQLSESIEASDGPRAAEKTLDAAPRPGNGRTPDA